MPVRSLAMARAVASAVQRLRPMVLTAGDRGFCLDNCRAKNLKDVEVVAQTQYEYRVRRRLPHRGLRVGQSFIVHPHVTNLMLCIPRTAGYLKCDA